MRKTRPVMRTSPGTGGLGRAWKDVILRRFETPDEARQMTLGSFEVVNIDGMRIARATYEPGWRWSKDVGRALHQEYCFVEHLGVVVSGALVAEFSNNGRVVNFKAGDVFYVPPEPHDSWVVGTEPYVSIHFLNAERSAK